MLLAALLLASPAVPACFQPGRDEIVLQSAALPIRRPEQELLRIRVTAIATKGGKMLGIDHVELRIWDADCTPLFRQTMSDATRLRFDAVTLGGETMLHLVSEYPGGSDTGYRHQLLRLTWRNEGEVLAPMNLEHGSMGGFFAGRLDAKRGDGTALWQADWQDGAHYDPHRQKMTLYRWSHGRFVGPEELQTAGKVASIPDAAPKALGFAFRDMTGPKQFEAMTLRSGK